MKYRVSLLVPAAVLILAAGCMTPVQKYSSMSEHQIKFCDKLLARNRMHNAPKVAQIYTQFLNSVPKSAELYTVHRRILLKRGEAYMVMGQKEKAEADFRFAAKIASRMSHPGRQEPGAAATAKPSDAKPGPGKTGKPPADGAQAGARPKPKRERPPLFSSGIEIWGSVFSQWRVLRDGPAGDGTSIHPDTDLGVKKLAVYGLLRSEISIFPRLAAALDLGIGSVSGEQDVDSYMKYDGSVLPYGGEVRTDVSFFEATGLLKWRPKLPLPGEIGLEIGAKYVLFTLDMDLPGDARLKDSIDAFYPIVGANYALKLVKGLRLRADARFCGLYYSSGDLRVSTTYFEAFAGLDLNIAPHLFLWGGLRGTYSTYRLRRSDEDKELTYSQFGPSLGFTLRV